VEGESKRSTSCCVHGVIALDARSSAFCAAGFEIYFNCLYPLTVDKTQLVRFHLKFISAKTSLMVSVKQQQQKLKITPISRFDVVCQILL
jgi:hypothetical protein